MKRTETAGAGPIVIVVRRESPRGTGALKIRPFAFLISLLVIQAGFGSRASATSIVGVRTPEAVVIAADSLLTIRGGEKPVTARACKIFPAGKIFFTLTGFYKDPDRHFDISTSLPAFLDQRLPLAAAAEAITGKVAAALRTELLRVKAEAPGVFAQNFPGGDQSILRILYAGYENDMPVSLLQTYRYSMTPSGDIAVRAERAACPGDCNAAAANYYFLTDRKAIDEYLKKGNTGTPAPEETARLFVDLVIKSRAPDTGPPIDVLRIDRNGAAWVTRKEECPEIAVMPERATAQP